MLHKKHILVLFMTSLLFLWSCFKKEEEKIEVPIIGGYVSDTTQKTEIDGITEEEKTRVMTWTTQEYDNTIWDIKSYLRNFCRTFENVNDGIQTKYFTNIKTNVDILNDDTSKFIYIELPTYVYESCASKDPDFLEALILYLQTDVSELSNIESVLDTTMLENFIKDLSLIDDGEVPKNIKQPEAFNDFFLNQKMEELQSFYYPYYMKEKSSINMFLWKPVNSLEQSNNFKELSLTNLIDDLESLWFNDLQEFRNLLLANNNYTSIDQLITSIKDDYSKIIANNEKLESALSTLWDFKTYVKTRQYKLIENDLNLQNLGKKMLILSIVSNDYADGLNETWAWKQFFWDEVIWNGIIRLNFIYILTQ